MILKVITPILAFLLLTEALPPRPVPKWIQKSSKSQIFENYQDVAAKIREYLTTGDGKGKTYDRLAKLADTYGQRQATSQGFKDASEYIQNELRAAGITDVWTETVDGIPNWSRGDPNPGQATLIEPRNQVLKILAVGNSTATPEGGIEANVVVVESFEELSSLADEVTKDSIIVYNQEWKGYSNTGKYRSKGAIEAGKKGAKAALIRSLTGQSLYTLHTGQKSSPIAGVPDIPVACITVEDAQLLHRLYKAGEKLKMNLQINTKYYGKGTSENIIAEIKGSVYPEEMIIFGGHFDSWDVGQGAMDDGGGVAITWQSLVTMRKLGLKPKRTIRGVFWTAEEWGYYGAEAYYQRHKGETANISLAMESDSGTFKPRGVHFNGNAAAIETMQQILDLLEPIGADAMVKGGAGGDNYDFISHGVPGIELDTDNENYFWYHHTNADSMTMMNSTNLDLCSTVFATIAYVVADLDSMLPHGVLE